VAKENELIGSQSASISKEENMCDSTDSISKYRILNKQNQIFEYKTNLKLAEIGKESQRLWIFQLPMQWKMEYDGYWYRSKGIWHPTYVTLPAEKTKRGQQEANQHYNCFA